MIFVVIKEFYSFVLNKRKKKERKFRRNLINLDEVMDIVMDQFIESFIIVTIVNFDNRNELFSVGITVICQIYGFVLMNIDF